MAPTAEQLLHEALGLPETERLEVASALLASVDGPGDPEWDRQWIDELDRRSAAMHADPEAGSSWADVRARLLDRLAHR